MAQERGSAGRRALTMITALLFILLHCDIAHATTFVVGDSAGWTFNINSWPKNKIFRAGDVLVFKYNPTIHNVVAVDRNGYDTCKTPRFARTFQTGNDRLILGRGEHFFICNFAGHCESGMKIKLSAL